ncbi:acyltransferase family protein [Pseudoduganella sp. OTU4001]|uniref:acyltransferase family protein n=1 Tax=Pseudoduganella sp. OTU4001 TaxID=3043854 RepID=UPI00313E8C44
MKSLNIVYNPRIDQLRWLAATLVFGFHFYLQARGQGLPVLESPWWGLVTEGHTGVGLFFTLSGFLFMQIALVQKEIQYGAFLRNRCLRILPLFLTVFVVAISIGRDRFAPQDLLYVLSTNVGLAPTSYTTITGAAWTISVEFTFYLVFPFLARFTLEQGARYLWKLLALMVFFKLAAFTVNDKSTLMYFSTLVGRFDQFLVGMLAALLCVQLNGKVRRHVRWLWPLSLLLVVCNAALQSHFGKFIAETHDPFWIGWSLMEAVAWSSFIITTVEHDGKLPHLLEKGLTYGGKISFSFYLLHMAMLQLLVTHFHLPAYTGIVPLDVGLSLVVAYAATWGLSSLSYSAIEEPFLRMRRRYGPTSVVV